MRRDPITGITFDEYLQQNGMTLEEAKVCFDKAAFIQSRKKFNESSDVQSRPWDSPFAKSRRDYN